ncbi:MAG TPA: phospholipase D family protein [Rhodocyclaceae bacterium]|nr:phospholipase D family protein [Rhodocyclaceae bacterium]
MIVLLACAGLCQAGLCQARVLPASGSVEALFSPWDDAEGALIGVVSSARQTIYVQAYLLTSRNLARALIDARSRGVTVSVLADGAMADKGESRELVRLHAAGIAIWLERRFAAAHNKVLLADPEGQTPVVVTGSYNFTWSAQARNAENLLILRGDPALALAYLRNWQRHRDLAVAYAQASADGHHAPLPCRSPGSEDAHLLRTLGECRSAP